MRASTFFPLVAGAAAGVVALNLWVKSVSRRGDDAPATPANTIVIAANEIAHAAEITDEMLTKVEFEGKPPFEGSFDTPEDLVGRVTSAKIVAGAPIVEGMLAPPGTLPGAENQIKPGFRMVSVPVKEYAVQHIEPGNRVDVLSARKRDDGSGERLSELVAQDVEVFAIGSRRLGTDDEPGRVEAVALLVPVQGLARLNSAIAAGQISLVARNVNDRTITEPTNEPVAEAPPVEPAEPAAPDDVQPDQTWTVRVFNGREERVEAYEFGNLGAQTSAGRANAGAINRRNAPDQPSASYHAGE